MVNCDIHSMNIVHLLKLIYRNTMPYQKNAYCIQEQAAWYKSVCIYTLTHPPQTTHPNKNEKICTENILEDS